MGIRLLLCTCSCLCVQEFLGGPDGLTVPSIMIRSGHRFSPVGCGLQVRAAAAQCLSCNPSTECQRDKCHPLKPAEVLTTCLQFKLTGPLVLHPAKKKKKRQIFSSSCTVAHDLQSCQSVLSHESVPQLNVYLDFLGVFFSLKLGNVFLLSFFTPHPPFFSLLNGNTYFSNERTETNTKRLTGMTQITSQLLIYTFKLCDGQSGCRFSTVRSSSFLQFYTNSD